MQHNLRMKCSCYILQLLGLYLSSIDAYLQFGSLAGSPSLPCCHQIKTPPLSYFARKQSGEETLNIRLSKMKRSNIASSQLCLEMKPGEDEDEDKRIDENSSTVIRDFFYIPETRLLSGAICTLLMACQLLGLADVLNRPEFWTNGGIFQPISLGPPDPVTGASTLLKLVQRDSIMSITWVLAALKNGAYDYAAIADNESLLR